MTKQITQEVSQQKESPNDQIWNADIARRRSMIMNRKRSAPTPKQPIKIARKTAPVYGSCSAKSPFCLELMAHLWNQRRIQDDSYPDFEFFYDENDHVQYKLKEKKEEKHDYIECDSEQVKMEVRGMEDLDQCLEAMDRKIQEKEKEEFNQNKISMPSNLKMGKKEWIAFIQKSYEELYQIFK